MATFRATFGLPESRGADYAAGDPVLHGRSLDGLTELTTSGTAGTVQSGGGDWTAPYAGVVTMVCDGAVWVAIGASPTAAVGTEVYLKADERMEFSVETDDKISVIDDS